MSWEIFGFIVAGLVFLGIGGELVVLGGVRAAKTLQVPTVIIGVVLLGFGTSLPELVTSLRSVTAGEPDIAIGNVVGSNIANILLIAGLAAALAKASVSRRLIWRDGAVMLLSTVAFAWLLVENGLAPVTGAALLAGLALFMLLAIYGYTAGGSGDAQAAPERHSKKQTRSKASQMSVALAIFGVGVACTIAGAWALVEGAVELATQAQLSKAVIGATIVAVGTSLPELAATISAALRGRSDMAIGNVVGSNIFNVLGIAGASALFGQMETPTTILELDVWIMLGATILVLILAQSWTRLSRREGMLLLLLYALYLALSVLHATA